MLLVELLLLLLTCACSILPFLARKVAFVGPHGEFVACFVLVAVCILLSLLDVVLLKTDFMTNAVRTFILVGLLYGGSLRWIDHRLLSRPIEKTPKAEKP
jgi:hypothetical protein